MTDDVAEAQARILRELGVAGGELSVVALPWRARFGPASEKALAELEAAELVSLDGAGTLRPGPRGSVLIAATVERRCRGHRLGHPVEVVASTPSTNDLVLDRAVAGAQPGLVCVAERQTVGRGRRGRAWDSRPGLGLWSTTLLEAPDDPALTPRLSLLAALAVAAAVERVTGNRAAIKWPNDVLVGGRKVAGILVEARSRPREIFPVAGIGVNVHHRPHEFPPRVGDAGSLEGQTGKRVDRSELLALILGELSRLSDQDQAGTVALSERFAAFDALRDREVAIAQGARIVRGVAKGIGEDGSLLLSVRGEGTRVVRSGEATLHGG